MLSQRAAKAYMALALQAQPAQAEKILSLFDRQLVESKAFAPSPAIRDTYVKLEGAWSDYKEKLIGKARTEFLAGMPTLGDAPEATARIKQELKLGEEQWLIFDAAINSATGAAPSKEALSNVLVTSENLLTVLNDVTGMYAALAWPDAYGSYRVSKPLASRPSPKRAPVWNMNCMGPAAPAREVECTRPLDSLAMMPNSSASGSPLRSHAGYSSARMFW